MRLLRDQRGFTMIELQIVMTIGGILSSLAAPSVVDLKNEAAKVAATSNVHMAAPAVEAFYADHGTYVGMDSNALETITPGLRILVDGTQATPSSYCIYSTVGDFTFFMRGPGAPITEDPTPTATPCA